MPKKIIAVLVVMVLLCLTGCSLLESDSGNSAANAYIAAAQQAMDKQDYDAAAQILEEGLSKANDPALEEMLAEVLTKQAATKTENDAESELPAGEIEGVYESADGEGPAIKIENDTFYIDVTADSEEQEECTLTYDAEQALYTAESTNWGKLTFSHVNGTLEFQKILGCYSKSNKELIVSGEDMKNFLEMIQEIILMSSVGYDGTVCESVEDCFFISSYDIVYTAFNARFFQSVNDDFSYNDESIIEVIKDITGAASVGFDDEYEQYLIDEANVRSFMRSLFGEKTDDYIDFGTTAGYPFEDDGTFGYGFYDSASGIDPIVTEENYTITEGEYLFHYEYWAEPDVTQNGIVTLRLKPDPNGLYGFVVEEIVSNEFPV